MSSAVRVFIHGHASSIVVIVHVFFCSCFVITETFDRVQCDMQCDVDAKCDMNR